MSELSLKKPRRLTSLELSAPARGALRRIKKSTGMSFTFAVERGLQLLERSVVIGEPMPDADRAKLGLTPGDFAARGVRRNRKGVGK
jgi:hypothetical protein